ncbi:MOSC and FAD-binding oxidoreductase domain-containing protein [Rhizobium sp. BK376]|uniref:MOSC and FAD-binding oxidoreductase domain-containing protein n=1 Tax=Rhizobium sp. BK376 TaxID=2512149 RepID=UPI001049DD46|nr:MOSC and FAD-binding oxidoreductase domain-containing protein [Rhizobium sp. BK376]TCR92704.1 MOSC domain-containing protein YiiM [Rhizobium sp. BK376]
MARLLSVNVGLPRDIQWKGRTVHTGIWKTPVTGRCRVAKLNLDGDGQGDLGGHGGIYRAVFVYQIESYRHWQEQLKRTDFVHGQFGENFTIEGLPDSEVCIGDRYQIGSALFEVTQPRVTCYRVGIRTDEPRMPALLTGSGRPGFYFRVLQEGTVGAGDEIVKVGQAKDGMTVEQINALLYSPNHPRDQLERAMALEALSPGWRGSFEALLQSESSPSEGGNAGLVPAVAARPVKSGFRRLTVTAVNQESADVLSLTMTSANDEPLQMALPGQYVVLRLQGVGGGSLLYRSYSLSASPSAKQYRISVKIEPDGAAGTYVKDHVGVGDGLDVSMPRGSFFLQPGEGPVVLVSAGIGATPVLAMLHELASAKSTRRVVWVHGARDRQHHPFAGEVRRLIQDLPHSRSVIYYSKPGADEKAGEDFDAVGHLSLSVLKELDVPRNGDFYLCGPTRFMSEMKAALTDLGVPPAGIHLEIFDGNEAMTPGIAAAATRLPHLPDNDANTGPLISFARSGIAAHWNGSVYQSILELAEACDVPVRWSCRSGVCHNCESGLISGTVNYAPDPLDPPAAGNLLICCSQPQVDIVIDI